MLMKNNVLKGHHLFTGECNIQKLCKQYNPTSVEHKKPPAI
jgi:hypothetical protein